MANVSRNFLIDQLSSMLHNHQIPEMDDSSRFDDPDLCVPELVAARAEAAPGSLAISQGKISLTYKELNERANSLAGYLLTLGVGPDVVVAIYLNRSPAMIVAALGVLKAGGAYLPLDPCYPAERLMFMLKDAHAPVLVAGERMLNNLSMCPEHAVILDAEGRLTAGLSAPGLPGERVSGDTAPVRPTADSLAYVIYTSGSTGQPKGVELTHGGLSNLVRWHLRAFQVTPRDRASQLAALGFDAAVWEIWPYLAAGASICMPENLAMNEPEQVRDWLVTQQITIAFIATPLAERMIILEWPKAATLRIMLTGADTLHHYPPKRLRFHLINNYGPTEGTVVATSGAVYPNERRDRLPSIGYPIDNVQIYILNEHQRRVTPGEPGELYIGGAGLARGYRNRPDLTRKRFIANPFSTEPGARLYRTGDLACYLPDGQLAFLGRIDEQIKIRGFRIEPAEIVKVLDEHPQVQASVVAARKSEGGDNHLAAWFVPVRNAEPSHTDLRNFIAARLPEYMVPSAFVKLEALPLNSSGKVDRSALPAPDATNTVRDNVFVAPRTPSEERLAAMVAPLLGMEQVSVEDNFFMLGGHSLLGTQLIARVRDAFGIELTLRSLFDAPTVATLAVQVEEMLMDRLDGMSDEEAQRILAAMAPAAEQVMDR